MQFLRQATASQEILLGPFLDSTDGNTAETGLTIANTDIKLWKNGSTAEANKNSGGATHIASGRYYAVLDATDTDTLGNLEVNVHVSGALAVRREYVVLHAEVYDAMIAHNGILPVETIAGPFLDSAGNISGTVDANVVQISGGATAADNLELDYNGTGYNKVNSTIGTCTTNTDMRGTNSALLASSAPTNFVDLAITASTGQVTVGTNNDKAGYSISGTKTTLDDLNDVSTAQVNAEVDTALADIGLDHLLSASVTGTDIADNSIVAQVVSKSATADWDSYDNTTDSLEAVRDHVGDGTNLTEAGGTGDHLTAVPWNAAWDAEVQSEVADGLTAYNAVATTDLPTNFGDLAITATTGLVSVGTNNDKSGYSISGSITTLDGLNDLSAAEVNAEVDTAIETYHLDHLLAAPYSPDAKPGDLDSLLNQLVESDSTGDVLFTTEALSLAPTGGSAPTAAAIADAVWTEAIADHSGTSGSTAEQLAAAGAGGDPWATALPGSYTAGQAGKIVGDNINAPIATVDTVVDAIKAVTDNLPDSGALTSIAQASALATVDTNVDAILVDTDTSIPGLINGLNDPTAASIADAVWDEVITGAEHNVNTSAAKFLREASETTTGVTGTAQSATSTTLVLASGAISQDDYFNGERLTIIEGTGAGQSRLIMDSAASTDTVTVSHAWITNPDSSSIYAITGAEVDVRAVAEQPVTATGTVDYDDLANIETAVATAQSDLDILTGTDGVTLATSQPNYAPNTTTPLDASGIRTAVGLASANLDTQLSTIDTNVDTTVSGIITGAAVTGTLSTTQATTDLTGYADDQLIGRVIIWTSGACEGEASAITDYANTDGLITFDALTIAPSNSDSFKII